ncbi:MAG: hypothetical protein IPK52_06065 [Chloroflexi bacterium]|nr:hypothetical protein [Chloroflexota bacterium]
MRLILAGVVLDIIAVGLIVVLVFLPMAFNDSDGLNNFYARLFCESGERYVPRTTSSETSDGGTGYNLYALCVGERGEVDVTPKQTIIGIIALAIPLALGSGLQFLGAMQLKARRERPREVTASKPSRLEFSSSSADNPISWSQSTPGTSRERTLDDKLAEADEAYESRRISREEYDVLRKQIIDSST